jgi:hypothetical protein
MLRFAPIVAVLVAASASSGTAGRVPWQRGADRDPGPRSALHAIVGRVVDRSGAPVRDTFVTALEPVPRASRPFRFVSATVGSVTDERGDFRLDGLFAGEFAVVALPHNAVFDAARQVNRSGYANTFYPDAVDFANAKRIRVAPGEPPRITITIAPARLATVAGRVTGSSGRLVERGTVLIAHGDGFYGLDARGVAVRSNGTFVAPALQPGTYHFHFREGSWPPARGETPRISGATVVVTGADVTDVEVKPIAMVRGSGRVTIDPAAGADLNTGAVTIGAAPVDFDGNPGPTRAGTLNPDLTFEFRAWPGAMTIRATLPSPQWMIKKIYVKGVDVTDQPVKFVEGQEVSGIEIVLARR